MVEFMEYEDFRRGKAASCIDCEPDIKYVPVEVNRSEEGWIQIRCPVHGRMIYIFDDSEVIRLGK